MDLAEPSERGKFKYERDRPLTFHYKVDIDVIRSLGLPPARNAQYEAARNSIITEAVLAAREGKRVSYSRNWNFYSGMGRYHGTAFTYRTVLEAIAELCRLGLIKEWRQVPGTARQWQSSFWATPALLEIWNNPTIIHSPFDPIRLRDADGSLVDYRDTKETRRMRNEIEEINRQLATVSLDLPGVELVADGHLWRIPTSEGFTYVRPHGGLYRMFNRGSFSIGGRAYGWWQNIPKEARASLTINGQSVAEPDYSGLHAAMLYAMHDKPLIGDPYDLAEFPREQVKGAFVIGINARTPNAAIGALANDVTGCRKTAAALWKATNVKHAPIADALGSDAGMKLMRIDSEITINGVKRCLKAGIHAHSVHDSLIVPVKAAGNTADTMISVFAERFPNANPIEVKVKGGK